MNRIACQLIVLLTAALAAGCSSSGGFDSWRRDVETYVREKGGGDPTVLRGADVDTSHRGFTTFSHNRPAQSTDVNGVLVGTTRMADQPWLVFLVGVVQREKVKDIRVAALSVANGKYTWRVGKDDDAATHAYTDYNKGLARRRFPDRKKEPPEYLGFPREEDRFDLSTDETSVGVSHPPSGAKWHAPIVGPQKKK
jgi:hypothetical protein